MASKQKTKLEKKPKPSEGKQQPKKTRTSSLIDARVGNEFWKKRIKHGRDKIFSDPEMLWDCCCEYFKWCQANPWKKGETEVERPLTISGLCIFLGISEEGFNVYGKNESYKDFFGVVSKIKSVIYTQKYEGAAVGVFNSNIIARDLGLTDKKELSGGLSVISMDDKDQKA